MKKYFFVIVGLFPLCLWAQQKTVHTNMVWAGYFNTTTFNERFSLATDMQLRSKNWMGKWSQQLIRSGLAYHFNKHVSATAGMAWFRHAQYLSNDLLYRNEYRPWQEFSWQLNAKSLNITQRFGTEQRFSQQIVNQQKTNHYSHIFRVRYKLDLQMPLKNEKIKVAIGNELMVNPGKIRTNNFFDQDRIYAGFFWNVAPGTNLHWQLMKIIQKRYGVDVIEDQNVVRFNVYHQLNWIHKS